MSQQYSSVPFIAPYDYFIYIDTYDGNKYKARSKTGKIDHVNATNAAATINAAITALPATGGVIWIDSGTFFTSTEINLKDYVTLRGAGINKTILKLANGTNKDVIMANPTFDTMTANRPANGYFAEATVIHDVTLEGFSIDGNKANNPTGRFGLAKIAYGWEMHDIMVYNCKSAGIYTEWGTTDGCPGAPDPTRRCMEDYWHNVYVHHCDGQGVTFRGPHDSLLVNLMAWGCVGSACAFEASGTIYSGGCQIQGYHCFAQINTGTVATLCTANVTMTNVAIEGALGTGGIGLHITGDAHVRVTGGAIFSNETGVKIDGGIGYSMIDAEFHSNTIGMKLFGVQNTIRGWFHDNTSTDIVIGDAAASAGYNDIRIKCTRTPLAINWAQVTNTQNYLEASVIMLEGHTAFSGAPRLMDNYVSIYSINASTYKIPAAVVPFTPLPTPLPSYKKWGAYFGVSTSKGDGLWAFDLSTQGTATAPTPADSDGRHIRWTTGTASGDNAVIMMVGHVKRAWNARMRVKFRIENTDCRVFLGFRGNAAVHPSTDDPCNGDPGFFFGKIASTASWQILRNEGTGATVTSNVSGNPAPNTSIHTVDFWTDSSGYGLRLDNGADNYFTSEVPTASHMMTPCFEIETSTTAARYIDIFYAEIVQDL